MTRVFTVLWVFLLLQFAVVEWAAYVHGGYRATATGHLVALMLAHPVLTVAVPLVFVGFALHVVIDYVAVSRG